MMKVETNLMVVWRLKIFWDLGATKALTPDG